MGKMHQALRKAEEAREAAVASMPAAGTLPPSASPDGAPPLSQPGSGQYAFPPSFRPGDVDHHLVSLTEPHSPLAEQYRALRTNILALGNEKKVQVMVVTSAVPNEGKSVTSVNLACALAEEEGRKVVVVDADMRKPDVHKLLGVDNRHGLADYLRGGTMLEMVLQRSRLPNLWVLPAGRTPSNPAELIGGKRIDDLISRLRRDYDFVVFDSPPIISTTDAGVLSPRTDGTILVVRMGKTPRDVSKHAVETLGKARANLIGTVLTGIEGDSKDYYYYPYKPTG